MKTFVCFLCAVIMTASMALANNGDGNKKGNPSDGNSKVNTTIRCNSEKGKHPKIKFYNTNSKLTVNGNPLNKKSFTQKRYHVKKRRR